MQALHFWSHCGMQFVLDALIWGMLYIIYCNCEILIIDLTINFFSYSCLLIHRKCALVVSLKPLIVIFKFFCVTETHHFCYLSPIYFNFWNVIKWLEPKQNKVLKTASHAANWIIVARASVYWRTLTWPPKMQAQWTSCIMWESCIVGSFYLTWMLADSLTITN